MHYWSLCSVIDPLYIFLIWYKSHEWMFLLGEFFFFPKNATEKVSIKREKKRVMKMSHSFPPVWAYLTTKCFSAGCVCHCRCKITLTLLWWPITHNSYPCAPYLTFPLVYDLRPTTPNNCFLNVLVSLKWLKCTFF